MNRPLSRNIFDIPIVAATVTQIPQIVTSLIRNQGKKTFFYVNAHCLNIADRDREYKSILQKATLVYSGGFGPVLASRLLGEPLPQRTPTPDFIEKVLHTAEKKGWSIYLLGTKTESLKRAVDKLKEKFPKLIISGYHHGYFSKNDEKKVLTDINSKQPTILIVGMGTPKQEKFISENMFGINAQTFWAVGALFDVISGELPRAPLWIQKLNLEWFFRLFQEPRRLWKRYLMGNISFLTIVFSTLIKNKLIKINKSTTLRLNSKQLMNS